MRWRRWESGGDGALDGAAFRDDVERSIQQISHSTFGQVQDDGFCSKEYRMQRTTAQIKNGNEERNEQTMECPKCGYEMKVTESLAAPLIAAVERKY